MESSADKQSSWPNQEELAERDPDLGDFVLFDNGEHKIEVKEGEIVQFDLFETPVSNLTASQSTAYVRRDGETTGAWAIIDHTQVRQRTDLGM